MTISEKKQALSRGGGKPDIAPKEEKKDNSGFGGKPHLARGEFVRWFKQSKLYKSTGMSKKERVTIGEELFKRQKGIFFEKKESENILKKLKREKLRTGSSSERKEITKRIKLIKEFLGK